MLNYDPDKEMKALRILRRDGCISEERYHCDMAAALKDKLRAGMKCNCVDVQIGSYDNQVTVRIPDNIDIPYNSPERPLRETVCLDVCIAGEIKSLWARGIVTTGCCCGHNRTIGYVGVAPEHIPQMKALGYRVILNPQYPTAEDSFLPKYTAEEGG